MFGLGKILIVDDIHSVFIERAKAMGYDCLYRPNIDETLAKTLIEDCVGLVIRTKFIVTDSFLEKARKLKFIARAGAGMDNIDVFFAEKRGIVCINAPEGNANAVAEHTLMLLLALLNNLNRANEEIRNMQWNRESNRGHEIQGKNIAVLGYGNMGSAFAKKLSLLGANVLVYDKFKNVENEYGIRSSSLDEIFREADVLSVHVPLNAENRKLIDFDFLSRFKRNIFFINTSRGEVVDTDVIIAMLDNGRLLGAAFDVLDKETFPDLSETNYFPVLKKNTNIVLTPHVAGWTFESYEKISKVLADKLEKISTC